MKIFENYQLGPIKLANRMVMAPLTRSRAIGNVPNDLMVEYYTQRASAGLIITEGTSPAPEGTGYARIPGIWSKEQVAAWRKITDAVHEQGGKIFMQIMHTGRVSHPLNLPEGAGDIIAPSAVGIKDAQMYTDQEGMQPYPTPRAITSDELETVKQRYVQAARNAIAAGLDGVELHGANGYLLEQFLHPHTNRRTDNYGGSPANRIRFVVEVAEAVADAIGKDRTGIRLSPYGVANELPPHDEVAETYTLLAEALNAIGITYIHLVDHSAMGAPAVPDSIKAAIRSRFDQTLILSGGYGLEQAEADLDAGKADLIAFGRPFLANPDLVERFRQGAELNAPNPKLFYTPGPEGYIDYPTLAEVTVD